MRVKAKEVGYYGLKRRKVDEVFEVENVSDLGKWMEPESEKDAPAYKKEFERRDALKRKQTANRDAMEMAHNAIVKGAAAHLQSDNVL
jgi:hypothetical protein